jgi:NADH-quinone oxidoreductase subunit N
MLTTDFLASLPLLVITAWACLLLLIDLLVPANRKGWTAALGVLGLIVTGVVTATQWNWSLTAFGGMLAADGFSRFLIFVFLISGVAGMVLAQASLARMGIERGEFYPLILFTIAGMMLMASAADLIVVFLALELLSIPLYVLSGFARPRPESEESAMKYFLLGAFSSGFLVYGIALTYGATGSTALARIVESLAGGHLMGDPLLLAGAGLILVGLGFKVAAVPFHMWTPDVYEGAPSVVTAFMSVGAKAGGFAALLRVFVAAFPALGATWMPVVAAISALTMTLGNVAAIGQSSIKRMLAYSSIAHAGYILMALVAAGAREDVAGFAVGSALFYLFAYAVTNLGAWAVVVAVEKEAGQGLRLTDYAGLAARRPGLALAMALFMLSLTGLPPTVGFIGKFYVFQATLEAGLVWLALVGVITSLVSAYYYLRVVFIMYMHEGAGEALNRPALNLTVAATAVATFLLGILPGPLLAWATQSVLMLFRPA